jgi:hydroxymethylpyrimidine pyrophosphatase-like HAD family hydrolase
MKLSVLALDYDGTIAEHDRLDASVRQAIAFAREQGVVVLLVTGRILSELQRVAGDLHFVDGVVAENGAIVHFPATNYTLSVAPSIPQSFVAEIRRRGLQIGVGECLVDAAASDAPQIIDVIRTLEVPLVVIFNRSRAMVLAQGISKATGLQAALRMLRLSPRNTLAIGDAENDHELLRLSEVGAAVAWGSASLCEAADSIVRGTGPAAVAPFIRALVAGPPVPPPERARRKLRLGYFEDGREFSLAVRGRNVLVAGDAKSGKSWVAGLLCEQLILLGYSVCVIDPEGDYRTLEALPGVALLGGEDPPPSPRELLRALRFPDRSAVIDLSRLALDAKVDYIKAVLPALAVMRRRTGLPHRIVVDEAHYFLHDAEARHLLDLETNGYTVITYCASRLPQELLTASGVVIVTCESSEAEIGALRRLCTCCGQRGEAEWISLLGHLDPGMAAVLPLTAEAEGDLRVFRLAPRLTPHVRHREKYVDVPVGNARAFVFQHNGQTARRAATLREFVEQIERSGVHTLDGHLRRGDFSRWIADVFGDHPLAGQLRPLEARYRSGYDGTTIADVANAIRSRYDLTEAEPAAVHQ